MTQPLPNHSPCPGQAAIRRRWPVLLLAGVLALGASPLVAQNVAGRAAPSAGNLQLLDLRSGPTGVAPAASERQRVLRESLNLGSADDMRLLRTETDELGFSHERYQPYYQGVKVEHASVSLHVRGGKIETLSGDFERPSGSVNASPALSEATALQRATAAVGARQYMWQIPGEEAALKQQTGNPAASYRPTGELVWVRNFHPTTAAQAIVLAWKFNIYAADPVSRAWIYVDARNGQIVLRDNIIKHVNAPGAQFATRYVGARTSITDNTGSGFRLRETATGKGVTTLNLRKSQTFSTAVDFTDNDNNWTAAEHNNANKDNAALDAHLGAQVTQDYWTNVHGRDSYDDQGTVLLSYVHFGNNVDNAFWNGTAMLYGDGNTAFRPLTSIDVCAHEVGHAVMDATADLIYQNESGAMNEGFSDIWGCTIEHHFDPAKQKYLIGEDICLPSFGTALRSMSNPNAHSQPDTYFGTNWFTGTGDNGGVHTNSGVLNFWFFLLSNGGSGTNDKGTAFNVAGITIEKAEKIAYRTQRIYLTPSSNYAAGRKASMQAAIDLYGLGSPEVQSTAQAWRAVGVGTANGVAEAAPTITGFTPTSGLAGTVVTITGTNLGATMRVTFNGADATIATLVSGTSLTVTVPPGASTGLISLSTAAGTVTTSGLAPANFTITAAGPAPVITGFLSAAGQAQGGTILISGSNFTGTTGVSFNGTAATVFTVNSATQITATVPAGATTGPLSVTTPNGTAFAPAIFKVRPAITSFSPTSGVVGTAVTLTGTSLTGTLSVKFNGVYVSSFTVVNSTTITTTVPNGATTGQIFLHAPDGDTISLGNFTVTPSLAFTSFSPLSGPVSTTVVNIRGRGFTGTSAITFGGVNAPTFTVASDTELFVTVPVGAITGNIVVTTPLGPVTSPAAFTVTAPLVPTLTSFTPASGVVGDAVTITGTNFTGATAVTFNGTAATFTVSNSTTIFTTVPVGATTGAIQVTVPGGTATSATNYSVVVPGAPSITSFTPTVGNTGTVVTLTGTNFSGTTAVAFNGTAAAFTLVSSTSITATAPAGGTTGQISVTNGFGTGVSTASFFYPPTNDLCANTGLPVLTCGGSVSGTTTNSTSTGDPTGTCTTSVQATAGGVFYRFVGTGGSVTLTTCAAGTNYDTKLFVFTGTCGSYTCVIGNDDVTSSCSATGNTTPSIVTFTSVAGTNYFVFVSGFNSNQGNFTLTATCVPVTPTITSFTPSSGVVGTSVDITGTNLTAASAVTFNGTAATTFTVNSATSITATVPAGATTGPIGVTVPGGSGVSASNFTVLVAPTLTNLTPNSGLIGASITLTGTDLTGATGVSFNGTAAVTFSVTNATTATATVPVGATTGNVTITTPGGTSNGVAFTVITNQAPTALGLSPQSVAENTAGGSAIGNFSTTDPDAGNTHTYSLVAGTGSGDNGAFSISGNQLLITASPDFETQPSYAIRVRSTDQGSLFTEQTFTITVTNVNEGPSISPQTFSVNENSAAGTVVGTVAASDPDAGTSLTYSIIGGNTGAAFTFVGNQLQVQFSGTLDFETLPTYSLTVRVTDGSLFANATVTVNLNNLSEAPTAVSLAGQSVPENQPSGTSVGSLSTTGPGSGYTYSLVSGAGSTDNGSFAIVGDLLQTAAVLDFETQNSYAIRVRSTDTGNGGEFLEQTFTITVTNLNDAPTALGLSPQSVAENTPGGSAIGNFSTTDADAGNTFTYSLVSGRSSTDNGAFSISGNQLLITASPDFETQSSYAIRVRTTDQGGLSFEQPFTITVTNENEGPSISPQTLSIAENSANGTPVGTVAASDPDAGTTLTYSITGGNTGGAFTFVGSQLRVANVAMLDFETTPTFSLTVEVSDGSLTNSATVTVNLTDVVETAPDLVVSTAQAIPAGTYRNITITATGTGTLGGAVVVEGAMLVQNGGTFEDGCQVLTGPGTFTLEAGTAMRICHAQGIAASGASGAVQVTGARSFSPGASYIYAGTGAQSTGTGLPTTVQNLSIENGSDVTLTLGTRIHRVLTLASSGNLQLGEAPLTLLSDVTGTAMVENAGTGRVIGAATAQRFLSPNGVPGLGYHHLSSPVENTTVADLTVAGANGFVPVVNSVFNAATNPNSVRPYPTVFGYNETRFPAVADFSRGYFSPTALANPLVPGRGYSVYMKPLTPDFVGTLATGTVSVGNLTRTGAFLGNAEKSGWHLLGNPYPSPIDWDLLTVPQGMDASISVFQTKGGNNGIYLTRANGLGTLPDGLVAMGQAFFARVTGAAPVPFAFENSMRVTGYANPNAFRAAPEARPTLQLALARQGAMADERDAVTVYFQEGATEGVDARFDGFRPGRNEGSFPTLATVVAGENGGEAAIDGRPLDLLSTGTVVELLANLPQAGTWVLTLDQVANLDATPLVLLDRLTGTRTPLVAGGRYSFAAAAGGVVKGRFALVVGAEQATTPTLTMWPNPAHHTVQVVVPTGTTQVTVLDATGRAVKRVAVTETNSALNLSLVGLPAGVYVVKAGAAAARLVVE